MVGAMIVGRITTTGIAARDVPLGDHVFDPPLRVERGEEVGTFHLGSTVVLLVEKARRADALARGGVVRYGQPLLRIGDPARLGAQLNGAAVVESGSGTLQRGDG
jgi:phosphatidylserine decarboxylase